MPFNPTLPAVNSLVDANELRAQFNGLKDLIDAQAAQISSLQTDLATIPPGPAQIIDAQSNDPGALWIQVAAPRATAITVWRKGPSDPDFVEVASGLFGNTYDEGGLEPGVHTVKAAGVNAGGTGPESAPLDITVI